MEVKMESLELCMLLSTNQSCWTSTSSTDMEHAYQTYRASLAFICLDSSCA
uniref:Uncharacterized protein n=1 Tax=Arundo donax TaxID=35708 RepID=A0A0A9F8W4_ARUDO